MADLCSVPPEILVPAANETLELVLGSQVELNCTVRWAGTEHCQPIPTWSKDGQWLGRGSSQDTVWSGQNSSEQLLASVLQLNLTQDADFGVFACWISNATATFTLRRAEAVGHVPAVLAALLVLLLLVLLAVLYVQCRLNALLWYRDRYGELEINDGKLYDAYVSHANAPDDRKFIHFIVKPQLENRHGYKLFLDEQNILPNSEPSADLIMNVSRCRRLIVVLSVAYLEQEWCNSSFRWEHSSSHRRGEGLPGPSPSCHPLVSQGRALEAAGAFQETHLHRLREPVPGDHSPCHHPAEAAPKRSDPAGVESRLHDPIVGLLEGAVPGPAAQGVLPGGKERGGPADPAAGGQGPHADPAQQLPGQRGRPGPRRGPRHRPPRAHLRQPPAPPPRWARHSQGSGLQWDGGGTAEGRAALRDRCLGPGVAQLRRPHGLLLPGDRG
ncbi:single Ig IL-1-related receptor isoform 2-T2 [Passerculus sandwichensis]